MRSNRKTDITDVYLNPRAVVRAFRQSTLSVDRSLFIFGQGRDTVLSDATEQFLADLLEDEAEYGTIVAAFSSIRTADPPAPNKSRVAWVKDWNDLEASRRGINFLLNAWGFKSPSIVCWNNYTPFGFNDAVRTVLEKSNPKRFNFHS